MITRRSCCVCSEHEYYEFPPPTPGGHVRPLEHWEWSAWMADELCPADARNTWVRSPLYVPVEVRLHSTEHMLCQTVRHVLDVADCDEIILAHALAAAREFQAYAEHLLHHPHALEQMCGLDVRQHKLYVNAGPAIGMALAIRARLRAQALLEGP